MKRRLTRKGFGINLRPGTRIIGKWQKNKYTIIRKLGSGMVGSVYLCQANGRYAALKISRQSLSMTKEVNVLQSINRAQDKFLGPCLFDVDDWEKSKNESYSFYVMEYIRGEGFIGFMEKQRPEWIVVLIIQMIDQLHQLHKIGWVFGDLKVDNLIIEQGGQRVRFIDVGGTTKMGRSIKEYTEFYDRGYWGLGSRRAEPSYDLFALVMVILTIYYPTQFKKHSHSARLLEEKLDKVKDLAMIRDSLKKAIKGKYNNGAEMKKDILYSFIQSNNQIKSETRKGWFEPVLILLFANIFYISTLLIF